jgi:hypothetical protein
LTTPLKNAAHGIFLEIIIGEAVMPTVIAKQNRLKMRLGPSGKPILSDVLMRYRRKHSLKLTSRLNTMHNHFLKAYAPKPILKRRPL